MKRQMRKAMKRFMAAVMVAGMLLTVPGTVSNEEGIVVCTNPEYKEERD